MPPPRQAEGVFSISADYSAASCAPPRSRPTLSPRRESSGFPHRRSLSERVLKMSRGTLNLHSGGEVVRYEELDRTPIPEATRTWHPIAHRRVVDAVVGTLAGAGFRVRESRHS